MQERITDIKKVILNKKKNISFFDGNIADSAAKIINSETDIFIFDTSKLTSKKALELGFKIRQLCSIYDTLFIVKDRVDLARILDSDGVHFDKDSYDIKYAKQILGPDKIFGITVKNKNDFDVNYIRKFDYAHVQKTRRISRQAARY